MMPRRVCSSQLAGLLVLLGVSVPAFPQGSQDLPRFTGAVDVASVDASVFDDRGRPVTDLKPEEFVVRVDGSARRIVSAEWIPLVTSSTAPAPPPPPEGYSSNDSATGGRLILIVIDQPNIRFGGTAAIKDAVKGFIDRLEPSDRAAVIGIGAGSPATSFTADKERLKGAVERMIGQYVAPIGHMFAISTAEAMDIRNDVPGVLDTVINRECQTAGGFGDAFGFEACALQVEQQARETVLEGARAGEDTIGAMRNLLNALKAIDAPKTMIFVSEGFLVDNQQSAVYELGSLAGAARTTIYTIKLDDQLMMASAAEARAPVSPMADRYVRAEGLEILAGASRGTVINVIGNGANIFDRIATDLTGYYLIAVESSDSDRDGRAHPIRVEVTRKGLTVRSRRSLLLPTGNNEVRTPREAVAAALATPLPMSALPLRVATFSLQGPEVGRVQLLIHADIGSDYATARTVTLAYTIADLDGRIVESQAAAARLPPIMTGVPSPLQFAGGASLPPGEYVLKLAAADADRVGTVEHRFRAGLVPGGPITYSDLMVGGPNGLVSDLLQPTIGHTVVFGSVHAYVEAYGADVGALKAKYEIAKEAESEALFSADVSARTAGDTRAIFTQVLPVRQLPPGEYVMRVTLSDENGARKVLRRGFEVAAPAVLMTSAATSGGTVLPPTEVYLPVTDAQLARPFEKQQVLDPSLVARFRERVPEGSRAQFDAGVRALASSSYGEAERSFKQAVSPEEDSSAVLAYVAATFAATGHDVDAAGAWQSSLITGDESPEVYDWLAGALMRSRNLAQARSTLEEAVAKWPSDTRFAKPLALLYATFGQGQQAVRMLERHLAAHKDDADGMLLGVEWLYQLALAGTTAHSRSEDLRLARRYADAYLETNGDRAALVRQWIDFLEKRR